MDRMDAYAQPLEHDIEAKSESWFAEQGRGIAEGFTQVGQDAWRDIGNSYQSILTQDAGWQAQWNARGAHGDIGLSPGEGDTTIYVGLTENYVDTTVYVGLSEDIGQQQEAAEIDKAMDRGPDKQHEPNFHI